MCILFFVVGDEQSPTIVCNNRDEYLARETVRGSLLNGDDLYCPVDQVGGGSWLSFSGLSQSTNSRLKFAIVLNYHHWRQSNVAPLSNEESLLSRGLLIKNFMEGGALSGDYARDVYANRATYRPFNLVVSDHSGCYYVSSDARQEYPQQLERNLVYGLSNGYMGEEWQKVSRGVDTLKRSVLPKYVDNLGSSNALPTFAGELLDSLLRDDTPLEDPSLGSQSPAIMVLAAIFVKPCLILRRKLPASSSASTPASNDGSPADSAADLFRRYQQRTQGMLKICQLLPEGPEALAAAKEDVFATRTSTVFVYRPASAEGEPRQWRIVENDLDPTTGEWSANTFSS